MSTLIFDTATRALFHTMLLFSLFLLFAGHNAPGGGFIGGLVAVVAFVLRWLARDAEDVRRLLPVRPDRLLGAGILLAAGTGLAGLVWDGRFLTSAYIERDLPLLGTVKLTSVLVFDAGVYLVVLGLGLTLIRLLGEEAER